MCPVATRLFRPKRFSREEFACDFFLLGCDWRQLSLFISPLGGYLHNEDKGKSMSPELTALRPLRRTCVSGLRVLAHRFPRLQPIFEPGAPGSCARVTPLGDHPLYRIPGTVLRKCVFPITGRPVSPRGPCRLHPGSELRFSELSFGEKRVLRIGKKKSAISPSLVRLWETCTLRPSCDGFVG